MLVLTRKVGEKIHIGSGIRWCPTKLAAISDHITESFLGFIAGYAAHSCMVQM